jgi:hypothetical protein
MLKLLCREWLVRNKIKNRDSKDKIVKEIENKIVR